MTIKELKNTIANLPDAMLIGMKGTCDLLVEQLDRVEVVTQASDRMKFALLFPTNHWNEDEEGEE